MDTLENPICYGEKWGFQSMYYFYYILFIYLFVYLLTLATTIDYW